MTTPFELGVSLAQKLETAMNDTGGWDYALFQRLCNPRNLRLIRELLTLTAGDPLTKQSDPGDTDIVDVDPQKFLDVRKGPNGSFEYVSPAILTTDEVKQILGNFGGDPLQAMRTLLVENKNEPYRDEWHDEPSAKNFYYGSNRKVIIIMLEEMRIGERRFRLARKRIDERYEYQLWEIRRT